MHLKSLRLYSLFLVALGSSEGCVLYKAENRAGDFPLPGHFLVLSKLVLKRTKNARKLNHAEKLENLHDSPRAKKPQLIKQIKKNSCYHMLYLRKV